MKKMIFSMAVAMAAVTCTSFDVPKGWVKAGSTPQDYDMGLTENETHGGKRVATIQSLKKSRGFGTLMQNFLPGNFLGKKVKMSAWAKSKGIQGTSWAGFWFRVDQAESYAPLAFDNMQKRPIQGDTDWTRYEIILDVPERAVNIAYGCLLSGAGQIWFDDFGFEAVGEADPDAKPVIHPAPANTGFEE